jgi:hypothetical protein
MNATAYDTYLLEVKMLIQNITIRSLEKELKYLKERIEKSR